MDVAAVCWMFSSGCRSVLCLVGTFVSDWMFELCVSFSKIALVRLLRARFSRTCLFGFVVVLSVVQCVAWVDVLILDLLRLIAIWMELVLSLNLFSRLIMVVVMVLEVGRRLRLMISVCMGALCCCVINVVVYVSVSELVLFE